MYTGLEPLQAMFKGEASEGTFHDVSDTVVFWGMIRFETDACMLLNVVAGEYAKARRRIK